MIESLVRPCEPDPGEVVVSVCAPGCAWRNPVRKRTMGDTLRAAVTFSSSWWVRASSLQLRKKAASNCGTSSP